MTKSSNMTIQMRATKQYIPEVLFSMLYMLILTFESVDEILKCGAGNNSFMVASQDDWPCKF